MTSTRGSDYNLSRHLNPNKEEFIELPDPTVLGEWVPSIAGKSGNEKPSRRKEYLKAHARFVNKIFSFDLRHTISYFRFQVARFLDGGIGEYRFWFQCRGFHT